MKIAFLAAANSIHSVRWIKYFVERGHEVSWISLAPPIPEAEEIVKRVTFHEITPSPLPDISGRFALRHLFRASRAFRRIVAHTQPDLMHIHSVGTYGLIADMSGFRPMVLTAWGSDVLLGPRSLLKRMLLQKILRNADMITTDGDNTEVAMIELGARPQIIHKILFGTDVKKFAPAGERKQGETITIISLRSLEPVYDIETLIRAASLALKKNPHLRFLIAGGGSERERLEALARELGLGADRVSFLGKVRNDGLVPLLQSADIYVSTSLSDSGLSASTAEAMATGLPVLVSDSGDNRAWVASEYIFPLHDAGRLAEQILNLASQETTRREIGERNRTIIVEKNNYYAEMEKMECLYELLLSK